MLHIPSKNNENERQSSSSFHSSMEMLEPEDPRSPPSSFYDLTFKVHFKDPNLQTIFLSWQWRLGEATHATFQLHDPLTQNLVSWAEPIHCSRNHRRPKKTGPFPFPGWNETKTQRNAEFWFHWWWMQQLLAIQKTRRPNTISQTNNFLMHHLNKNTDSRK